MSTFTLRRGHHILDDEATDNPLERRYKLTSALSIGLCFVVTSLYGFVVAEPSHRLTALMAGFLAGAAPYVVGGFIGFLFGIPRTLQGNYVERNPPPGPAPAAPAGSAGPAAAQPSPVPSAAPAQTQKAAHAAAGGPASQANTNLEQISDWLTKIIVGIGLTQLTNLPAAVQSAGDYVATAISPQVPGVIGSLILIVFSIVGFVRSYLTTRADLARELELLELESLKKRGRES